MLPIRRLRAEVEEKGHVLFSIEDGRVLDASSTQLDSPTLLVTPVTDALKDVSPSGMVMGSIDRERVWRVTAVYLDVEAFSLLEDDHRDMSEVHAAVVAGGLRWTAQSAEDVLYLPPT